MNSNNGWDDFSEFFSQSLNYSGSCSPDTVVSIDSSESYLMTVRLAYETENEMSDLSTFDERYELSFLDENSTLLIENEIFELTIVFDERLDEWTIDERF